MKEYSVKPPSGLLWKTGYTLERITRDREEGKIQDDWLVCPLGEASEAVTVGEFLDNPSVLEKEVVVNEPFVPKPVEIKPMSMASFGWWVFFGSLFAYLIVTLIAGEMAKEMVVSMRRSMFPATVIAMILKGLDALIIAGAITALLGHGLARLKKWGQS
ncbi:MAG: hypothetical protein ACON38_13065 [Akkermansiaceae bacterium]